MGETRRGYKRRWVCTNTQGRCPFSEEASADLNEEVPLDKKCPLCESEITIFGEAQGTTAEHGLVEFLPVWWCRACGKTGTYEEGGKVPSKCPNCGREVEEPIVKKGGPYDHLGLEEKY